MNGEGKWGILKYLFHVTQRLTWGEIPNFKCMLSYKLGVCLLFTLKAISYKYFFLKIWKCVKVYRGTKRYHSNGDVQWEVNTFIRIPKVACKKSGYVLLFHSVSKLLYRNNSGSFPSTWPARSLLNSCKIVVLGFNFYFPLHLSI